MTTGASDHPLRRAPYHIGLATYDIQAAMGDLGRTFGLRWAELQYMEPLQFHSPTGPVVMEGRGVHSAGGPMRLELIQGVPGSVWETDELVELHHHAYWSDDVAADVEDLRRNGWEIEVCALDADGRPATFAYLVKPDHFRIELVDAARQPAYRDRVGAPVPLHV